MGGRSKGIAALACFAGMSATVDVVTGSRLQSENTIGVAAISFTLAALFFLSGELPSRASGLRRCLAECTSDVIGINVGTVLSWLPLLFALRLIEPAIANVVSIAIGPAIVILLRPLLMPRGTAILPVEKAAAVGIVGVVGALFAVSAAGDSAVGHRAAGSLIAGSACAALSGLGSSLNVFYGKRLHLHGVSSRTVMACRFFLVILLSWSGVLLLDAGDLRRVVLTGLIVAVLGLGLPMYTVQFALRYTEPMTAAVMMNLAPGFTFLLQFLDPRLHQSILSLVCVCLMSAMVVVSVAGRERHDRSVPRVPLATGDHATADA